MLSFLAMLCWNVIVSGCNELLADGIANGVSSIESKSIDGF